MSETEWADLLATIRFVVSQILQIVTAVGVIAAAYFSYRGDRSANKNSVHLQKQDVAIDVVNRKVDGQMTALREAGVVAVDKMTQSAVDLKIETDHLIDDKDAQIADLKAKLPKPPRIS